MLPASVSAALDWETIVLEPGSFIGPELEDRHSDLLFSVRLRDDTGGPPVLLYLLLEHQSTNDDDMPLRILVYVVRIWERYRKEHTGPLPIVIPAVVSHAPDGWTAPLCFHEMFDPRPDSIPGLARLVPGFSLLLQDLMLMDEIELRRWELPLFAKLTLSLLRDARDADRLPRNLPLWFTWFEELARRPDGRTKLEQALLYVLRVAGELHYDLIRAKLRENPETEEITMTIADKLRAEALAGALTKLMTRKFGTLSRDDAMRIASATESQLQEWIDRILTAFTPDDVFGHSSEHS